MSPIEPTLSQVFVTVEWMDRELGVPLELRFRRIGYFRVEFSVIRGRFTNQGVDFERSWA
jgi:hypothetical protein